MTSEKHAPKLERPALSDLYESLSQDDDDVIAEFLGVDIDDVMEEFGDGISVKGLTGLTRTLEFVYLFKSGVAAPEAHAAVRLLTRADLTERFSAFTDHVEEAIPEDPDTEEGKDDSAEN